MRDLLLSAVKQRVRQGRQEPGTLSGDGGVADALRLKSDWLLRGQPGPTLDLEVADALIMFFWLRSRAGAEDEDGVNWRRVEEVAGLLHEHRRYDIGDDARFVVAVALQSESAIDRVRSGLARAQGGDATDLEAVCQFARRLTKVLPLGHPLYVEGFALWGVALTLLPGDQRTDASVQQGIEFLRHAMHCAQSVGLPGLPFVRFNLANVLRSRFEQSPVASDLQELIQIMQRAHSELGASHPVANDVLGQLVWAYIQRFELLGDAEDLDAAVRSARLAVGGAQGDQRANALRGLAHVLDLRYRALHHLADLEESIWHQQGVIDAADADDSQHAFWLSDLSTSLLRRFQHDGDDLALQRALDVARAARARLGPEHPARHRCAVALGNALSERFERWGEPADGEESLQVHRQAVALSATDAQRGMALSNLGSELQTFYEREGRGADLDEAVQVARASLRLCGPQETTQAWRASNLAAALRLRFRRTGALADLEEAIELGQQSLSVATSEPDRYLIMADRLGLALQLRFLRFGDHDDLDASISLHEQCVNDGNPSSADHASHLLHFSRALAERYHSSAKVEDLEEALAASRRALAGLPQGHAWVALVRNEVASLLGARAARLGREVDLREAIELLEQAAADALNAPATLPLVIGNLGFTEVSLYELTEDPAMLTGGVAHLRRAIAELPDESPERPVVLGQLAHAMRTQFEVDGALPLLTEAIEVRRQALTYVAEGAQSRSSQICSLAEALAVRAERLGTRSDIEEAVDLLNAAAGARADLRTRNSVISNLAQALRRRFDFTGDVRDLDASVAYLREALSPDQPDDVRDAIRYSSLCLSLRDRFGQVGDADDVNAAFDAGERSVAALGERPRVQDAGFHGNFALAAIDRFEALGDISDLEVGITEARMAVDLTPVGHPDRPMYMSNLTTGLLDRYHARGQAGDLDEALDWAQAAVDGSPDDDARRGARFSNLGAVLHLRYILARDRADLERAVVADRSAVEATAPEHPSYVRYVSNKASALVDLFRVTGKRADIDRAVDELSRGVARTADDHRERGQYLSSLSGTLRARYDAFGAPEDLLEAVTQMRAAVACVPVSWPERALYEMNLGLSLLELSDRVDPPDRRAVGEALGVFATAAMSATAPTPVRLRSAVHWGQAAAMLEDWAGACDGFTHAVGLLPQAAWHGLDRSTRERHLAEYSGIATSAASCAIRAGRAERAVELLDHGRTVLWQEQLNAATDLTRLVQEAPALAEKLRLVRRQLDSASDPLAPRASPTALPQVPRTVITDTRMRLAREWDETLAEVRRLAGFADFLVRPSFGELVRAADEGPVIILNASAYGCHAIVVRSQSPVLVVPLDQDLDHLMRRSDGLFNVVAQLGALSHEEVAVENRALLEALDKLRREVTGPVLDELGLPDEPADTLPRVWWCPTGVFTLLPLHASALERVVSSYTSTLAALIGSRSPRTAPGPDVPGSRHLVVALSDAPGQEPLPGVEREVTLVRRVLTRHMEGDVLDGRRATRENVAEQLRECSWLHLACHAAQDILAPSDSAFALWDGELRVEDLISLSRRSGRGIGELAYLSACQTSTGGVHLVDEAIHLAGALQAFGYRQVIGTLWSIADGISPDLAERFYEGLSTPEGLDPARAARSLNLATRRIRQQAPDEPFLWAAHVHSGP